MPCGYDAECASREALDYAAELAALGARRIVAVNASAYFSRPGPRLIDGLEQLGHILHPERLPSAPAEVLELELAGMSPGAEAGTGAARREPVR
jgi:iron complex transport system substrate-binding protein